jgi:capsid protein
MADDFKATGFERMLAGISPQLAVRRMMGRAAFQMMSSGGYSAAGTSRYRKMQSFNRSRPGSEEGVLNQRDRLALMLEGADLYRNSVVSGAINRFADYAVCYGLPPTAQTSDTGWNRLAESWWNDIYVGTADFRQQADLYDMQKLTLTSRLWAGGCGYILLSNGQIEPIEYERIRTPDAYRVDDLVVQGVRRTSQGIVVGFYVCPRRGNGSVDTTKYRYIKAENFIHCYKPWRFDQLLGVPDLAPLIEKMRDYDETDNYIINKIKNEAMRLVAFSRKDGGQAAGNAGFRGFTKTDENGKKRDVKKQEWGMEFDLPQGDEMELLEGKTPSQGSIDYLEHTLRIISACFGVPYEFLLLMFKEGSYSTHRAASLHAAHAFSLCTDWLSKTMMNRLWSWRIAKAIKEGTLPPAPVNEAGVSQWWKVEWIEPYFESNDPDKQANGDKTTLEIGTESVTNLIKGKGRRRENVWDERTVELDDAAERVKRHNEKHPEAKISIEHFTNAATPGAKKGEVQTDKTDKPEEKE